MSDTISSYKIRLDASMIGMLSPFRGLTESRMIFCASSTDTVKSLVFMMSSFARPDNTCFVKS